jgi:hypothetical protein
MILHAFSQSIPIDPQKRFTYWICHGESMTPVRVSVGYGGKITLDIVSHPAGEVPEYASHPDDQATPESITREVIAELTAANPKLHHKTTRILTRQDAKLPDYLIVFDVNGEHPAIWHTVEPQGILPIDEAKGRPATKRTYHRLIKDLSGEGWAYWWQDAHDAYQKLAPAIVGEEPPSR